MNDNNVNGGDSSKPSLSSQPSFSKKLHTSLSSISTFFRRKNRRSHQPPDSPDHVSTTGHLLRCSSLWGRSRGAHHQDSSSTAPEIKDKCRSLISRMSSTTNHRRHHSSDFRYDPLSYSMNFDGGGGGAAGEEEADEDEFPFKSFSSRLPLSPPRDDDDNDDDVDAESGSGSTSKSPATRTTTEIVSANC